MMAEGKYDPEYERLCYEYRYLFTRKQIGVGASWRMPDWFVNTKEEKAAHHYEVAFIIPTLEQLHGMLTERIRLCQQKDQPENVLLVFTSELPGWLLQVQLAHHTFYGRGNSPHAAYLQCVHQMSPHVASDKETGSYKSHQQPARFTQEYIDLCRNYKSLFRARRRTRGEWYGNVKTGEIERYDQESVGTSTLEWFYIPELDELFAFLDNQIMLTQEAVKPAEMVILNYKPVGGWEVMIKLENGIAHSSGSGKSPHEVLFKALFGMAAFDVRWRKEERPSVSVNPQRLREFAWRMELERNSDLWDDPPDTPPAINNGVSKEDQHQDKDNGLFGKVLDAIRKIIRI